MEPGGKFEFPTCRLQIGCSNQLSYPGILVNCVWGKSSYPDVSPLYHITATFRYLCALYKKVLRFILCLAFQILSKALYGLG